MTNPKKVRQAIDAARKLNDDPERHTGKAVVKFTDDCGRVELHVRDGVGGEVDNLIRESRWWSISPVSGREPGVKLY